MKKYLFGLAAIVLAIGFSAFTTKSDPTSYVFKYVGPSTPTQAQLENRLNWNAKVVSPFTACTASTEQKACSYQTDLDGSYLTSIGSDLYKPSTTIKVIGKLSVQGDEYVVQDIQLVSNNSSVAQSIENINQP